MNIAKSGLRLRGILRSPDSLCESMPGLDRMTRCWWGGFEGGYVVADGTEYRCRSPRQQVLPTS